VIGEAKNKSRAFASPADRADFEGYIAEERRRWVRSALQ